MAASFITQWRLKFQDYRADLVLDNGWLKIAAIILALYLLLVMAIGIYWSLVPQSFSVTANAALKLNSQQQSVTGAVTTATIIQVAESLLDKPGGLISNDISPPGIWLDNMPSWEYGVLIQLRDMSKAMRESFSRSQSQSLEDTDLAKSESRFNFNSDSWAMPSSESEYRDGILFLDRYLVRLVSNQNVDAQFYARADNLNYWLRTVETRLGNLSQRLSASVGQRRLNTDLAGESDALQATPAPREMLVKTPWTEIDNVFYEARGAAWALAHFLQAVEVDFAAVLQKKNARVSLSQIIRELEASQQTVYSPMILNGSGFGLLANHSLVMASYISRANAAIIDLRSLLDQG
jgi:hypothetical protein|tara:strand:+ start:1326 stop:2375 length:1050 start_codon:yes stop_codon:yes gene_type:complete